MFIYVFCKEARDELVARGMQIMKEDNANERYIFLANSEKLFFSDFKHNYALSEVLTF